MNIPPYAWLLHWRPGNIARRLETLKSAGIIEQIPNFWQLTLGVLYMWHRAWYRPQTIGMSPDGTPVRDTLRARWFAYRGLRAPFLVGRCVNPLDHTGLGSSTSHVIRHVVGAYHPGSNVEYDLQMIAPEPGALERLREAVATVVEESHPISGLFAKDLAVYEGYHQGVLEVVDAWIARGGVDDPARSHDHADTTLKAFLTWCTRQPPTPTASLAAWRRGELDFDPTVEALA